MKAYKHRCQSLEKQLERMKENQSNMFDKVMKKNMAALEAMVHTPGRTPTTTCSSNSSSPPTPTGL